MISPCTSKQGINVRQLHLVGGSLSTAEAKTGPNAGQYKKKHYV